MGVGDEDGDEAQCVAPVIEEQTAGNGRTGFSLGFFKDDSRQIRRQTIRHSTMKLGSDSGLLL